MAENTKYNLKNELLAANEKLTGDISLMGKSMLTVPMYNNSMRTVMNTSHLGQFVNLTNPDFPAVFTNGENTAGKHSSGYKKTKHDTIVFKKIIKFDDIIENPFIYKLFVYDKETDTYDVWERKDSEDLTEVFGYQYNNDVIDTLNEGDTIPKDTVVYKSDSYDEYMNYGYGKNVTLMYGTDPYTAEDGCVVAESLTKEMVSIEINTVSIGINQNEFLLNLYGDKNNYKPFPDIGEYTKGEICAKRTLYTNQLLTDFKDKSLNQIMDSDVCYYKSGQVVDINVYCNNPDLENNLFNEQIIKYLNAQNVYYEKIAKTCEEIFESTSKYTHNIDYLYKRACEFLNDDSKWKDNDSIFGNLLIEIQVKQHIPLQKGQKITGRYGNKGVISQIRPDDEMPYYYDDNGNKVIIKLLFNTLAIINRTTAFPIYELTINFITNKVRARMKNMKSLKEKENLLFGIIEDFNEEQAREMKQKYDKLSKKDKEDYINSCIEDRIYIHQKPMWETKPIFFRLLDIYNKYDFLTPYDVYINKWGMQIKLMNQNFIGEMYILKLKQTSRKGFIVRSTGSINTKGLPERSYNNKLFRARYSTKPIRFGEFETLNFGIAMIPEDVQLFHLLYRTSVKGRRDIAEQLLSSNDEEFKISSSYTSRTAEIFAVILKSLGLRLDFIDEDDEIKEYDDSELQLFITDDNIEYLCTEYQFMLVQRKKDIEKDVLNKYGVIDSDELDKLVMNELLQRNFVTGPSKEDYLNIPAFQPDTVK